MSLAVTAKAFQMDIEKFCRQEWKGLPTAYSAVEFLSGVFPDLYRKESLPSIGRDDSKLEDTGVHRAPEKAPEPEAEPIPPKGTPPKKAEAPQAPDEEPPKKAAPRGKGGKRAKGPAAMAPKPNE